MTFAELVSEFVYNGIPLSEVAGLDTRQTLWVYCRKRDERGRLVREDGTRAGGDGNGSSFTSVSYESMFKSAKRYQSKKYKGTLQNGVYFKGYTEEDIEALWQEKLRKTPSLKRWDAFQHGRI